jgi:Ca-activated chloride channel homolog
MIYRFNSLILLGATVFCTVSSAQELPAAQDQAPTFRADTNLVVLHASVFDKSGKLLTNIQQSAFHVLEDGVDQPIKGFLREDVPVSMGIVIDNSGSMRNKLRKVVAACMALVKESNPQDEVFIVNFSDDVYLDQTFTNDTRKLQAALDKITARGGTAMRDAISMSIDYLKDKARREKKVLLVVTDGNDNVSNISLEQTMRKAQQSEVLIYSIGLLNEEEPREARQAKRVLKALAEASGAMDYYPKDLAEVERITPQVAHEIRSQYMISYLPTNAVYDGSFRKIHVAVKASGNPTVRARNGYYATRTTSPNLGPGHSVR